MATPRSQLVDPEVPLYYHVTSRCVQRAWLLGPDPVTKRSFEHRKQWLVERFKHLGQFFALEVAAYAIMSNHFHMVIYLDPKAPSRWSDEEVARRWVQAFPPTVDGVVDHGLQELLYEDLLESPARLAKTRQKLGSLSCFMQHLKQPIARRANQESGTDGDFWANRFYSGALLDEEAILATLAYVDLNPIRAKIACSIDESVDTSIFERLEQTRHDAKKLAEYLAPIVSGLEETDADSERKLLPAIRLSGYVKRLRVTSRALRDHNHSSPLPSQTLRWLSQIKSLGKNQRAYGQVDALDHWLTQRGLRHLESALP